MDVAGRPWSKAPGPGCHVAGGMQQGRPHCPTGHRWSHSQGAGLSGRVWEAPPFPQKLGAALESISTPEGQQSQGTARENRTRMSQGQSGPVGQGRPCSLQSAWGSPAPRLWLTLFASVCPAIHTPWFFVFLWGFGVFCFFFFKFNSPFLWYIAVTKCCDSVFSFPYTDRGSTRRGELCDARGCVFNLTQRA